MIAESEGGNFGDRPQNKPYRLRSKQSRIRIKSNTKPPFLTNSSAEIVNSSRVDKSLVATDGAVRASQLYPALPSHHDNVANRKSWSYNPDNNVEEFSAGKIQPSDSVDCGEVLCRLSTINAEP